MSAPPGALGAWLVPVGDTARPGVRVVCLPHAGGSAASYPWLRPWLPDDAELLCVQYPGRQDRRLEPPVARVEDMAAHLADALAARGGAVPTVLFGHSLGALLAFALGRELAARGLPPRGAIVSGRRAPAVRPPGGVWDMTDEQILTEVRRLGGTNTGLLSEADLRELVLPVMRADYRLAASYHHEPGATLECPLVVLTGAADPVVSAGDADAWAAATTASSETHVLPGGHFFPDADRAAVGAVVREAVDRMRGDDGGS